jgi:hypothetical protein
MKSQVSFSSKSMRFAALAAFAASASVGIVPEAQAQNVTVFKSIRVDISSMPPGAGFARNQMQACLSRYVPAAFAGRINPSARNAPVIVVRPFRLTLTENSTNDDSGGGGGSDTMEGEAIVGGTRIPLVVNGSGQASSPAFAEAVARQRMDALCSSFAYWLARKI